MIDFVATSHQRANEQSFTQLEWRTGFEVANLGFNLYRKEAGKRARLNKELIAGSALFAGSGTPLTAGRCYAWRDDSPVSENATYLLEEIDLNGQSLWHAVLKVQVAKFRERLSAYEQAQAPALSDIGRESREQDASLAVEPRAKLARLTVARVEAQIAIAAQQAAKIAVKHEGWYRITQAELAAIRFNTKLDPRYLQLHVDGRQLPMIVRGEEDGSFDETVAVEFYGIGLDTPSTDTRVYWLTVGNDLGLRMKPTLDERGYESSTSFPLTVERRDRSIYFAALRNGEEENFFGSVVASNTVTQALTVRNLDPSATGDTDTLEVALQGVTSNQHQVKVSVNGFVLDYVNFSDRTRGVGKIGLPHSLLREGANTVELEGIGGPSDVSLVDFIRLSYQRLYRADDDALSFTAHGGEQVTITGFKGEKIRVFDVTDERTVQELHSSVSKDADGYSVSATIARAGQRRLIALSGEKALHPVSVKLNSPSNWRQPGNAADFVMISDARFMDSLKPLAALRMSQGWQVAVVDVEDIYDEFAFGHKSPQAIKDMLAYASSNWTVKPKFVMFVGDASYDPKNYLGFGEGDLVPTKLIDTVYLETASDDWFVDFDLDGLPELAVGRLPVRSAFEAGVVVEKLIAYIKAAPSNDALFVADRNDGFDFERASAGARSAIPLGIKIGEIFRSKLDDAAAHSLLIQKINHGQKLVNYAGHGSSNAWRGTLLTTSDAQSLTNKEHLSLFVMMTCLNGYFQDPVNESLAESLLRSSRGGGDCGVVIIRADDAARTGSDESGILQVAVQRSRSRIDARRSGSESQSCYEQHGRSQNLDSLGRPLDAIEVMDTFPS